MPEVRSRRVAIEVTRNIVISGKIPRSEAPMESKVVRAAVEDVAEQEQHHAGDEQHQRDGARVVAELAQDAGGGGEGAGEVLERRVSGRGVSVAHRVVSFVRSAAIASSTRCRKAASTVSEPVRARRASGVSVGGEDLALAHEEEAVAALGLVHDVGGDQEGGAAFGGEGVEEVPQVAAQDGVEADGGFVEDEQFGGAEEGYGEGDAAALAAGEVAGEGVGVGGEVDVGDGAGDVLVAAVGGRRGRGRGSRRSSRGSGGRSGRRRRDGAWVT